MTAPTRDADADGPVDPLTGETCTHPDRIGWEVRGVYDGVLVYTCPACAHSWPRFPGPGRLHDAGVRLLASWAGLPDPTPDAAP